MGDMGEFWNDVNVERKAKRASNLDYSTELLKENKINFISKNNGVHLIVENKYDFYPSTGLFINRENKKKKRGVKNLIKEIKE